MLLFHYYLHEFSTLTFWLTSVKNTRESESRVPGTTNQLDDRSKEEEGTVEGEANGFPVRPQKPIQHLKPLRNARQHTEMLSSSIQKIERDVGKEQEGKLEDVIVR